MSGLIFFSIVALMGIGTVSTVASVGKPRGPVTGGVAAMAVIIQALFIAGVTYLYAH